MRGFRSQRWPPCTVLWALVAALALASPATEAKSSRKQRAGAREERITNPAAQQRASAPPRCCAPPSRRARITLTHDAVRCAVTVPLHRAAAEGDVPLLRQELDTGADVNLGNQGPPAALLSLSRFPDGSSCNGVLLPRLDVCVARTEGWTALHHSIAQGHLPASKVLLESGADANRKHLGECPARNRCPVLITSSRRATPHEFTRVSLCPPPLIRCREAHAVARGR